MDGGPEAERLEGLLSRKIDGFVAFLEKTRLPLLGVFLYVIFAALVRDLLEYFLLDAEFVNTPHPWVFSIAHHVAFYVIVFMGLILLLSAFSGRGVKRSINFVSSFYWIIILPPILDHYVGGLNRNYAYFSVNDFLNAIFHFSGEGFHVGQAMEVVVILFALFAYTIWTQRNVLRSIAGRGTTLLRFGFLVLFTFVFMFIMATPAAFLPVGTLGGVPQFPAFDLTRYYQFHLFLYSYYLFAGIVLALVITYFVLRKDFGSVLRSMRPAQTVFFGAVVAAGLVTGWRLDSSLELTTKILETPFYVNLAFAAPAILAALLAWQVGTIWNDISDRSHDEPRRKDRALASGLIDVGTLKQISMILATVSIATGFLLSIQQGIIILVILAFSWVYSFRPIRFKDHILSPALIGLGTFLAFLYGHSTPYSEIAYYTSGSTRWSSLTGNVFLPQLTTESFIIGFFMFLGLTVGSMVTDVEGYEEDRRAGVRTIYTSLGMRRGVRIVAILIFLMALTPVAIFRNPMDIIVFPVLGVIAAILFETNKRARPVLLVALLGLLYAALRYLALF
ncbi:MAG: UbiA family prenyltransferase [Methanomassiliicoccales archaeon]|jgi:4-hydroxybenzoate polyprenyltransferase